MLCDNRLREKQTKDSTMQHLKSNIYNSSQFREAFRNAGRQSHFSFYGCTVLYHWLKVIYSDSNYELDVIALCCDFCEYDEEALIKEYKQNDEDELKDVLKYLNYNTEVIDCGNGSYLIRAFNNRDISCN